MGKIRVAELIACLLEKHGTDLTASCGGGGADSDETVAMVKTVARAAQKRGLKTAMAGSIGAGAIALLQRDEEPRDLLACVETRKCVMPVSCILEPGALEASFAVEEALLDMQLALHDAMAKAALSRIGQLRSRL